MNGWRFFARFAVRALVLAAVIAAYFGVPGARYAVKAQGLLWGVLATLLLGRRFCEFCCPLGVVQSAVRYLRHPRTGVRRVCARLLVTRRQWAVRLAVLAAAVALAAAGAMGAVTAVLPVAVVGGAVTRFAPALGVLAVVVVLALIGQGRLWCNWICPFGTVYALVARFALFKERPTPSRHCAACGRCFAAADGAAKASADAASGGVTRRATLQGLVAAVAAEKLTDGGLADVSLPGVPERGLSVLPPGAGDRRRFTLRCAACQLCVANCPGECLRPSLKFANFGQPEMDFRRGHCLAGCVRCGEVCPEGALSRLVPADRPHVHMGFAVVEHARCVREISGDRCTACVRKCPVKAIHFVEGFPVVDRERCIGCGACEHVCPARPLPAVFVKGCEVQRIVRPMGEADLALEMRRRLAAGAAAVVARGGVIVREETGGGIAPILKLLDEEALAGATVADKVVGRAAAAVFVVGRVRSVCTPLAAAGAAELLAAHGIALTADETVPAILNRRRDGPCPMEQAVAGSDDPAAMVAALKAKTANP